MRNKSIHHVAEIRQSGLSNFLVGVLLSLMLIGQKTKPHGERDRVILCSFKHFLVKQFIAFDEISALIGLRVPFTTIPIQIPWLEGMACSIYSIYDGIDWHEQNSLLLHQFWGFYFI